MGVIALFADTFDVPNYKRAPVPNDRQGRKKGDRLGRQAPAATCAPSDSATASAGPSSATVRLPPREWENNHPFTLIFVNPSTNRCASCNNDILFKLDIPGERLVIQHNERYEYPSERDANGKWKTTKTTVNRTRPVYDHALAQCIYTRFREVYFHSAVINIDGSGVRGELRAFWYRSAPSVINQFITNLTINVLHFLYKVERHRLMYVDRLYYRYEIYI